MGVSKVAQLIPAYESKERDLADFHDFRNRGNL